MAQAALEPLTSGLRVLQWNVLIDSDQPGCIDQHVRGYVKPAECLLWSNRCKTIADRVAASNADVAFLEECTPAMLADLLKHLSGHEGWQAGVLDGGKDRDFMDVALLVRSSTVEVLGAPRCRRLYRLCEEGAERETVLLPGNGEEPPKAYAVLSVAVRRRGEEAGPVLVLGGTHLRWEYGEGFGGAAAGKPLQAKAAVRHLMEHVEDMEASGWALCGDFNSGPSSAAYELLTSGRLAPEHKELLQRLTQELLLESPLRSAFATMHQREPLFTRKKETLASQYCLDYIFVGGALEVQAAGFGAGPAPYASAGDGSELAFLPSETWPSDHLPLVADLQP